MTAELTQKQNKPVGGHWTDFSNNYGGCTTDVKEDVGPENRYQPMRDEEQCLMRKCMDPLKYTQRYRVCMLPDHPDVVSQRIGFKLYFIFCHRNNCTFYWCHEGTLSSVPESGTGSVGP